MDNFIDPVQAERLVATAVSGMFAVFLFAIISTVITMVYLKGRRITFMLVFWGMFLIFSLTFYGLNYLMRDMWKLEESMGSAAIHVVSLGTALGLMALYALYCKFSIQEGATWLQKELDDLPEDKLSPMDIKRREHMAKYRRK
jgi:ABC-type multidrug transport system permease subunit